MDHAADLDGGARLILRGIGDDGAANNCDLELVAADGSRWSATVLTTDEIGRLMTSFEATGECLAGAYFACPDLLVVRDGTVAGVESLMRALWASEDYRTEMRRLTD
jgi:hypothetical protein